MRRFDEPPHYGQYYQHRPGAYGIFTHSNGLLLTGQMSETLEWQLPGGGVDKGESTYQALRREALEETGWHVSISRKIGVYKRFVYMPEYEIHAEKICHIFLGQAIIRKSDPIEADHISALVPANTALRILVNQGDREMLKTWL